MSNFRNLAAASALLLFAFCKNTKSSGGSSEIKKPYAPEAKQMAVVETRWPGTSADHVNEGYTIYTTKCTQCHANQTITDLSEKKWLHEIDDMSPKAKLSADEKLKLTKFILSYREAYTASK